MCELKITTFTDPMMGLSYECEPIFRKLETHFPSLTFDYVMSGLVADVYDWVNPTDLAFGKTFAIEEYNKQLAKIYESEENITGMPINMTDFKLFSTKETSSIPLNLAYKAAQLVDKSKADLFLYNLRYATIVDYRPTTQLVEILKVVDQTGLNKEKFLSHYQDGSAEKELMSDFTLKRKNQIRGLPAYLITYQDKQVLIQQLIGYETFVSIINQLTEGKVKPEMVIPTLQAVSELIEKHPLISPIEIREALNLGTIEQVERLIQPLIENDDIKIKPVHHGWFIEKQKNKEVQ